MGGLSKDPTPNTCVTVCGVGGTSILYIMSKIFKGLLMLKIRRPCFLVWCSKPGHAAASHASCVHHFRPDTSELVKFCYTIPDHRCGNPVCSHPTECTFAETGHEGLAHIQHSRSVKLTHNAEARHCCAAQDACTEACQQAVCTDVHQVPAWNDACLKRCTAECMRGRSF